jgi:hypothetical protein
MPRPCDRAAQLVPVLPTHQPHPSPEPSPSLGPATPPPDPCQRPPCNVFFCVPQPSPPRLLALCARALPLPALSLTAQSLSLPIDSPPVHRCPVMLSCGRRATVCNCLIRSRCSPDASTPKHWTASVRGPADIHADARQWRTPPCRRRDCPIRPGCEGYKRLAFDGLLLIPFSPLSIDSPQLPKAI